jgi:hypothetical protein
MNWPAAFHVHTEDMQVQQTCNNTGLKPSLASCGVHGGCPRHLTDSICIELAGLQA